MKNRLMPLMDRLLLRKRALIQTIYDQFKNICQIEHSHHRSVKNFQVNTLAAMMSGLYDARFRVAMHLYSFAPRAPANSS